MTIPYKSFPWLVLVLVALPAAAETLGAQGESFITFKTYTREEDEGILAAFEGLRVADVSDGMDVVGLQDVGLVDPGIQTLWRDVDDLSHRICGLAVTVRYVPTNRRAGRMTAEEFE